MSDPDSPRFEPDGSPNAAMRRIARCPACWSDRLEWAGGTGARCAGCGFEAPFRDGLWMPVVPDATWRAIVQDTVALFMDFVENREGAKAAAGLDLQRPLETFTAEHEGDRDALFFEVWERLRIPREASVLEVAAGDIRTASALIRRGHHVVAVEPVPEFLRRGAYDAGLNVPRVCCSSSRLPFASESFDMAFCQAALHHLDDMRPVLNEMARVVKRGGTVLVVAEPYSAVGSSIARLRATTGDMAFDMGINEQVPRFSAYHGALRRAGVEGIRAYSRPGDLRPAEKLRRLGIPIPFTGDAYRDSGGVALHVRHRLTHGQVSLWGRRSTAPGAPPPLERARFVFDPEDYTVRRTRPSLVGIWKRLARPEDTPGEIVAGRNDVMHLRRGFLRGGPLHAGRAWRWLQTQGAVLLDGGSRRRLRVTVAGPDSPGGSWRLTGFCDDAELGAREVPADDRWHDLEWEIPAGTRVCEVRLRADRVEMRADGVATSVRVARVGID